MEGQQFFAILAEEFFRGFPQYLQANDEILPLVDQECFLPNLLQCITRHESSVSSTEPNVT
jgi:hypothetical protein